MVRMLLKTYSPVLIPEIATASNEKISVATAGHLEGGTRIVAPTATFALEEDFSLGSQQDNLLATVFYIA
jgi:hypothetical protein